MKYSILWLTCKNKREADEIAAVLLEKRLVACVKSMTIGSAAWWENKIEKSKEVLLMMESREDLFDQVKDEIDKLHSYDTPVLMATAVSKVSNKAEKWLTKSLKNVS